MPPAPKREPQFSPELLDWTGDGPCLVCSVRTLGIIPSSMGCEPHHVTGRADGDIDNVVGLCRVHHREGHDHGWKTFERKYRISLRSWAVKLTAEWRADQAVLDILPFAEETHHVPKTRLRKRQRALEKPSPDAG
jgi:hypothetical protein